MFPDTALSRRIDPWLRRIGEWASWLWLALLLVIVTNVLMRYAFGEGRVEFEEIQWHVYAAGFLLGLSYAAQADAHIRVDVVRDRLPLRWQAWIELYGTLLLLLPFIALILIYGVPFALTSYQLGEHSQAPGGLPWRWIIKSMLPFGFVLLALAALSRLSRVCAYLFRVEERADDR
jgi:TRAP-type mannitol/chloroaromatic compound transport system permease small subunit